MALPVFSSKLVNVAFGSVPLSGLSADSFITFSRNSDLTTNEVGADGQLQTSVLPDKSGSCTISLQQNSLSNAFLSDVLDYQDENGRLIVADLTVTDPSGSILAELKNAHLMTAPEVSLGSDAAGNSYDWTFYCETIRFTSNVALDLSTEDQDRISAQLTAIINL